MAIKRPAEPPSPSSTVREARLQLGRPHCDSRPHAVRPDRAGKEQGRPAREGWWSEALQGGMCAASAASSITAPAQQHVDMDWTWDARPGDGSQNSVQVAGGRYRVRPVVDRVNHARPHRRTRGLRDSMVLEGKADLQLPPGRAPSGRAALLGALRRERHALRNDHGVDLHTEAASQVVRRTDWHAIGQLGVLTAWLKPALLHWRDTAPVWMLHRCGGEPGGWQTRATGRRAPKRRYGVAASPRASLMATGEYII